MSMWHGPSAVGPPLTLNNSKRLDILDKKPKTFKTYLR